MSFSKYHQFLLRFFGAMARHGSIFNLFVLKKRPRSVWLGECRSAWERMIRKSAYGEEGCCLTNSTTSLLMINLWQDFSHHPSETKLKMCPAEIVFTCDSVLHSPTNSPASLFTRRCERTPCFNIIFNEHRGKKFSKLLYCCAVILCAQAHKVILATWTSWNKT